MNKHIEYEHKYLIKKDSLNLTWDKKILVYQFFERIEDNSNIQLKIIIDFANSTVKYARIIKKIYSISKSLKDVEYLDETLISTDNLIGVPFVLKKRLISKPYFVDKYIIPSMDKTDLLEIEYEEENLSNPEEIEVIKRVSGEREYMNEYMAKPFNQEDKVVMEYLLKIVRA